MRRAAHLQFWASFAAVCLVLVGPVDDALACVLNSDCGACQCCNTGSCVNGNCNANKCPAAPQCNAAVCQLAVNPVRYVCATVFANEGGSCNDGDLCTYSDYCASGTCFGWPISCVSTNPCVVLSCNGTIT